VRGPLWIDAVVYAEASVRFPGQAGLGAFVAAAGLELRHAPRAALVLAGRAFRRYRAAGGPRTGVLPDVIIGAHAAVVGAPLLTCAAGRSPPPLPGPRADPALRRRSAAG
jgi:predicted nucleic acid-binding protein